MIATFLNRLVIKRIIARFALGCLLSGLIPIFVNAQHDLSLYNMEIVPQRIFQNPAFIPDQHLYVGIPVLSGIQTTYANPFSYNDLIERDSYDSVTFKVDDFLKQLSKTDQMRLYSNIEILSLGTRIANGNFYVGFSIRERLCQHLTLPVNMGYLLWYGNTAPELFGKDVNIAPAIDFTAFDEWAASFSGYAMKKKLTWGVRLKYLSGRINATTKHSEFDFYTDTSTYVLHMKSDFELQTSGIDDIEHYLDQKVSKLVFPGNNGFGIDLGATYQINKEISANFSILDLGFINWRSRTMDIVSHNPGAEFIFDGLRLDDFIEMAGNMDTFAQGLTDSILNLAEIDTIYGRKYTTGLPVRYNLGGTYTLNNNHHFNLLLNGISWGHRFYPALSVSYYYQLPRILGLMVSYNIFNRQFTNIGAGISINAGPVQLYVISDNVPGLIAYRSTSNSSIQFGLNITVRGPGQGK